MPNLSYGKELDLQENKLAGGTHFDMNGFAQKLVFRGKKATGK